MIVQKPGDCPNFRTNALGVKRPFSELWERSGGFSIRRSSSRSSENNSRNAKSHSRNGVSRRVQCENHPERFPELMGTHMEDFHLPMRSRSVFSRIGVVPARQSCSRRDGNRDRNRNAIASSAVHSGWEHPDLDVGQAMRSGRAQLLVLSP